MMARTVFPGVYLLFISLAWSGGVVADEASHRQRVETLFRLTNMEGKIEESVDGLLELQLRQTPSLVPHRALVEAFLREQIGWSAMHDLLVDMYLFEFTEQELEQMNAFYITPTGQKVLERLPVLVQARNTVAAQRIQSNIGELQRRIAEARREGAPSDTP